MKTSYDDEYSRTYLEKQKLPACHLSKLKFDSQVISQEQQEWNKYLERLGITSQQAIKLVRKTYRNNHPALVRLRVGGYREILGEGWMIIFL